MPPFQRSRAFYPMLASTSSVAVTNIFARYAGLKIAIIGDFCLDRYFEIDPAREELSLETGLPAHQVVRVRGHAGGAGTVLNNLVALGVGSLPLVGFCGEDGEGYELQRALRSLPGVELEHFVVSPSRCTFTYGKPLVLTPGEPPRELSRLDRRNLTPTPPELGRELAARVREVAREADALIIMEQVDAAGTGAITAEVHVALQEVAADRPERLVLVDSRLGVGSFPDITAKMNLAELRRLLASPALETLPDVQAAALRLARERGRMVFVTLAERGIIGASPEGRVEHVPAFPVSGELDVVGAGDSVTANLAAALAAGADLPEAMRLAMAAANLVVQQLGTTGVATPEAILALLGREG